MGQIRVPDLFTQLLPFLLTAVLSQSSAWILSSAIHKKSNFLYLKWYYWLIFDNFLIQKHFTKNCHTKYQPSTWFLSSWSVLLICFKDYFPVQNHLKNVLIFEIDKKKKNFILFLQEFLKILKLKSNEFQIIIYKRNV